MREGYPRKREQNEPRGQKAKAPAFPPLQTSIPGSSSPNSPFLPPAPPKPVGASNPEAMTTNSTHLFTSVSLQPHCKLLEGRDLILFAFVTLAPRSVPGKEDVSIHVFDK